jgi:hypothetical protein
MLIFQAMLKCAMLKSPVLNARTTHARTLAATHLVHNSRSCSPHFASSPLLTSSLHFSHFTPHNLTSPHLTSPHSTLLRFTTHTSPLFTSSQDGDSPADLTSEGFVDWLHLGAAEPLSLTRKRSPLVTDGRITASVTGSAAAQRAPDEERAPPPAIGVR